ncbi:condensin [Culex quinquefasciatus]|uniref:Condensin n=1 Tax=Culex quinquefasciatus TaxID=7176 RepID=B0W0W9_CULQU|nr:condensin [Culex quinquefasciatus]|eukprot:XP_001842353.1 condensin [Culex quinquefasciatus]
MEVQNNCGGRFRTLFRACNLLFIEIFRFGTNVLDELVQSELPRRTGTTKDEVLYNLFQLPLEKLRRFCEESFVESSHIFRFQRNPVRILQIMEHHCADRWRRDAAVRRVCIASIYLVLIKELVERLNVDTTDSQTAKHMSQLLELGMLDAKLIIPHLSTMSDELRNLESYVVHNCVLQIMGKAIEELADELKETRDDFLHDLFNHTMDVSAHVRSKVLQIRHCIQGQNAVPFSWQHQVLEGTVERLEDKSLLVRKNSIALIKTSLEHNPFSAKLSLAELCRQYGTEDCQPQEIRNKMDAALKKTEQQCVFYMMVLKVYYVKTRHGPKLNEEFQKKETRNHFGRGAYAARHGDVQVPNGCVRSASAYLFGIKGIESGVQHNEQFRCRADELYDALTRQDVVQHLRRFVPEACFELNLNFVKCDKIISDTAAPFPFASNFKSSRVPDRRRPQDGEDGAGIANATVVLDGAYDFDQPPALRIIRSLYY